MLGSSTAPINFNIKLYNNTEQEIPLTYSEVFSRPLIDNPSRYELAMTKAMIPSSALETFRFDPNNKLDNERYKVSLSAHDEYRNEFAGCQTFYTTSMPDSLNDDLEYDYGPVRIYSPEGSLDIISRMFYITYQKYIADNYDTDNFYRSISDSMVVNDSYITTPTTKTYSVSGMHANSKIADVVLKIDKFILRNGILSNPNYDGNFQLVLTSPAGTECVVVAQAPGSGLNWPSGSSHSLVFTDGGYRSQTGGIVYSASETRDSIYLPCESLAKFLGEDPTGTWQLTFNNMDALYKIEMDFKIQIWTNMDYAPCNPPRISFDSNNKIVLKYQKNYQRSSVKIGFSPLMNNMINFGSRFLKYNSARNVFEFQYPAYNFNSDESDYLSFTQPVSTRYLLNNIVRFVVTSVGIPTYGELNAGQTTDDVMVDFVVDGDSQMQYQLYTIDYMPYRKYGIDSTVPLSKIDLTVWCEYSTGERIMVTIPPGQTSILRLSFFEKY